LTEALQPTYRRIAALAVPALVVLAAEPLYVLVDTAVVGHLGRVPLAGLAVGGSVLSLATLLGTFLAYGTTGRAARLYGAGREAEAVGEGVQASWLAVIAGVGFVLLVQAAADPLVVLLAGAGSESGAAGDGSATVRDAAEGWLRIAVLGAPGILLGLAGNGWMRGVQDYRRPVRYVLAGNLLSAVACPLLVYGPGPLPSLGLTGSAIANVGAQAVAAGLFVTALLRTARAGRPDGRRVRLGPDPAILRAQLRVGRDLLVRTVSFQACSLSATAVAARFGAAVLAAHQIALQLWFFLALVLDAVAVAAQSLVGEALGAGRAAEARRAAMRVGVVGVASGVVFAAALLAGAGVVPGLFTGDARVLGQAAVAWSWFALMQPAAGLVFALDGVLVGAGDVRFLRDVTVVGALAGFLPAVALTHVADLGIGGIWAGLTLFVLIRLVGMTLRVARGRWAVVGAVR
jgi:putative MATE family efflux protein